MSPFRSCHARHQFFYKDKLETLLRRRVYEHLSCGEKPSSLESIGKDYENVITSFP